MGELETLRAHDVERRLVLSARSLPLSTVKFLHMNVIHRGLLEVEAYLKRAIKRRSGP
jgi:hypothetical protein